MNIRVECQVEEACKKDDLRPALAHVWVERPDAKKPTEGLAVACDGFILAVVPVSLEADDVVGFVPPAALKAARKQAARHSPDAQIALTDQGCRVESTSASYVYPRNVDGVFPEWRRVVPKVPDEGGDIPHVALETKLLLRLAKALGCDTLKLYFDGSPVKPVLVRPSNTWRTPRQDDLVGVVMPPSVEWT
jgi:hypothetical protein